MTAPHPIRGLSEIAANYDVLLCDVWGVLHNGRESWPAATDALVHFRESHGPVVLISNSPRLAAGVEDQLAGLHVRRDSWDGLVTSGDVTRVELTRRAPGPAWRIGPDRDSPLYQGAGVAFVEDPADAAFISVTGPFDDETETPEDYRDRFAPLVARDLEMVCANPDRVVQRGSKLIYCGGALADLYAEMGGRVTMAGKPYGPIYDLSLKTAVDLLGRPVDRSRVLCIGDAIATDVRGANSQALDCLFVASGIHADHVRGPDGAPDPERAHALLAADTAYARYTSLNLEW